MATQVCVYTRGAIHPQILNHNKFSEAASIIELITVRPRVALSVYECKHFFIVGGTFWKKNNGRR